jgi:hypothetical protein
MTKTTERMMLTMRLMTTMTNMTMKTRTTIMTMTKTATTTMDNNAIFFYNLTMNIYTALGASIQKYHDVSHY